MLSEWMCHWRIPATHVVAGLDLDAVQRRAGDPRKPATHPWVTSRDLSWVWWSMLLKPVLGREVGEFVTCLKPS